MLWRFVQENLMQFACLLIVYTKVEIEAINFNSSTDVDALSNFQISVTCMYFIAAIISHVFTDFYTGAFILASYIKHSVYLRESSWPALESCKI